MTKGQQNACRLLEIFRACPDSANHLAPILLLNRVLQQFLYWVFEAVGPHKLLQVGCDIRLKAKEMDLFVFRQCSYSYPSFRLKIPSSRLFRLLC